MTYKCKCGSINIEVKKFQRFEAEATLRYDKEGKLTDEDASFGTKVEEANSFLHCMDCHHIGHPLDKDSFIVLPDTT